MHATITERSSTVRSKDRPKLKEREELAVKDDEKQASDFEVEEMLIHDAEAKEKIEGRRGDKKENVRGFPTLLDDKMPKEDKEPKAHMHKPKDRTNHKDHKNRKKHMRHQFSLLLECRTWCFSDFRPRTFFAQPV